MNLDADVFKRERRSICLDAMGEEGKFIHILDFDPWKMIPKGVQTEDVTILQNWKGKWRS